MAPRFDPSAEARAIATDLEKLGFKAIAAEIKDATRTSFSGTEILMHLAFVLRPVSRLGDLPAPLQTRLAYLLGRLDQALQ